MQVEDKPVLSRIHSDESWKDCRSTICSPLEKSPLSERKPLSSNGQLNLSSQDLRYIDDDRSIEITSCVPLDDLQKSTKLNNNVAERESKTKEATKIIDDIFKNPSIVKLLKDRSSIDVSQIVSTFNSSDKIPKETNKIITTKSFQKTENDLRKLSLTKQLSLASDDECTKKPSLDRQSVSQDLTSNLSSSQEMLINANLKNGQIGVLKANEFKSQQMLNIRVDRSSGDQSLFNNKSASQQLLFNAATEAYQQRLKNDFKSQQLFESTPMSRVFKSQQTLTRGVRIQLMEYYNDHEQCLEEYRKQKAEEEEQQRKLEEKQQQKEKEEQLRKKREKLELELIEKLRLEEERMELTSKSKEAVKSGQNEIQTPKHKPEVIHSNSAARTHLTIEGTDKTDYEG